jgi:hypothetical protein
MAQRAHGDRRRSRATRLPGLVTAAAIAALELAWPVPAHASSPTTPAAVLQAKAIANAENAGWVHEDGRAQVPGHTFSAVDDIGLFEGRQVIDSDRSHAVVVQIGQQAYIRGNASAIANYFGLTKNDPQQLANTWISLAPSDGQEYTTVIDAVTLKSDFGHQTIPGPVTEGRPVTVHGTRAIPIVGHTTQPDVGAVTLTLYVTTSKRPLPVELKATSKKGTSTTTWSRWGKPVTLTSPPDAIPLSSLGG